MWGGGFNLRKDICYQKVISGKVFSSKNSIFYF